MLKIYLVNFLNILINAFMVLIFVRVLLSWVPTGLVKVKKVVADLTEPLLAPLRKLIPPIGGGIDLSPLIAFILLQVIQSFIANL